MTDYTVEVSMGGSGWATGDIIHLAKTTDYTILNLDRGKLLTNTGAVATVELTLPTAVLGLHYYFTVVAAQIITITPQAGATITFDMAGSRQTTAAGTGIDSTATGATCHLVATSTTTWTEITGNADWDLTP